MTQVCLEICNLMADTSTLLCRYLFWTTWLVSHEILMAMQIFSSVSQAFLCSWPLTSFNHLLGVWSVTILRYLVNRGKVITWSLPTARVFLKRKLMTSETLPPCIKISSTCLLHKVSLLVAWMQTCSVQCSFHDCKNSILGFPKLSPVPPQINYHFLVRCFLPLSLSLSLPPTDFSEGILINILFYCDLLQKGPMIFQWAAVVPLSCRVILAISLIIGGWINAWNIFFFLTRAYIFGRSPLFFLCLFFAIPNTKNKDVTSVGKYGNAS